MKETRSQGKYPSSETISGTRELSWWISKLSSAKPPRGELLLADEISPDTCRFWDEKTMNKLDKDRFRKDLGDVLGAYREILRRLTGEEL